MVGSGYGSPLRQPNGETLAINRGASTVYSTSVRLSLFCRAAQMVQVANGPDPTGAPWVNYVDLLPWTLPSGDGSKTVSARFRLFPGNYSTIIETTTILEEDPAFVSSCDLAMSHLRDLVANCTTFQDWTGTATPEAAQDLVKRYTYQVPIVRPYALITEIPECQATHIGSGPKRTFETAGGLSLMFEADPQNTTPPIDWEREILLFNLDVGRIVSEMKELTCRPRPGRESYLCIERFEKSVPTMIPEEDELLEDNVDDLSLNVAFNVYWR